MNALLVIIASLLLSTHAFAESVLLKNGTVLKGVIIEMNQTDLIIDTAEMGRVTVKRYTIQKISDDNAAGAGAGNGTVINVNNSNNVEQKNEQTNNQVNSPTATAGKEEGRRWKQGIQGRFNFSQETVRFHNEEKALELPKSYSGINWDLIGFRSESWWAVYLEASSLDHPKDGVNYKLNGGMIRLDWNAVKSVNGDSLSLLYFGLGLGSGSFETEYTDELGQKTSVEFSGKRGTLRIGYDYFWGKYWGLSAFGALNSATYNKVSYKIDGEEVTGTSMDDVAVSSTSWGIGLLYNFDL